MKKIATGLLTVLLAGSFLIANAADMAESEADSTEKVVNSSGAQESGVTEATTDAFGETLDSATVADSEMPADGEPVAAEEK